MVLVLLIALTYVTVGEGVQILTKGNFDQVVNDPNSNVLVEFFSPTCIPCKSVGPIFERVGEIFKYENDVVIANVDTAVEAGIHSKYQVTGLPAFIFFSKTNKNGEFYSGEYTEKAFTSYLNQKCGKKISVD